MNNEIVLFETDDKSVTLPVMVDQETVWLTQDQMRTLFDTSKQNVSLHINNCFREGELNKDSVVKESLTTANDGKRYKTKYYNLDVIISVGYRVKSKRGVEFRKWANSVLKQYILEGYAVNQKRLADLGQMLQLMKRTETSLDYDCRIQTGRKRNDDQCYYELSKEINWCTSRTAHGSEPRLSLARGHPNGCPF